MSVVNKTLHASHTKVRQRDCKSVSQSQAVYYQHGVGGWPRQGSVFDVLEPYDGKLSRPVLRGVWDGNTPDSLGELRNIVFKIARPRN
jgi:hypothetical protein